MVLPEDDDEFYGMTTPTPLPRNVVKAACEGNNVVIQEWFSTGADPDKKDYLRNPAGQTLLHFALRNNKCDAMRLILSHGANVDADDFVRLKPLEIAAGRGYHDAAVLLLDHGAEINRPSNSVTPLMRAAHTGCTEMIHLLLHRGAALDTRDTNGKNAEDVANREIYDDDYLHDEMGRWRETEAERTKLANADRTKLANAAALLAGVRLAGSLRGYVRYPRFRLLALRLLAEQGRAETKDDLLGRLFPAPPKRQDGERRTRASKRNASVARTALPKEVFWRIFGYWRSSRDYVPPIPRADSSDGGGSS